MSFRSLNSPPLVAAAGAALAVGIPMIPIKALSIGVLQTANIVAFCTNVAAVSVPGRIDGAQQSKMQEGTMNPSEASLSARLANRNRTLLMPAGWAFAIWGPIYLGEATFCAAQLFDAQAISLSSVTAPFVAANLFQSLWCVSFRPSYDEGWNKYISVLMLGGTAFSLSFIPAAESLYFVPFVVHFGWTTAATLVNLNGSLAMSSNVTDSQVIAAGHSSTALATLLGAGLTLSGFTTPVYGLTVAWALAAVANGVKKQNWPNKTLETGAGVQETLAKVGSVICLAAAAFVSIS